VAAAGRIPSAAESAEAERKPEMSPETRIQTYDATLRDGMGGGGMTLTAAEKLRVVHALDELGVDMIEAGFPASNPKEQELFSLLAGERLERAEIVAFGMTRRRETPAAEDAGLRVLADCFAPVCTLVGKASVLHVEKVVRVTREENLAMIADSVAFLAAEGKRVLLDAEHFFDGFALDAGYALECLRAAAEAGAERVVLCDTNGGSLPPQIRTALAVVREALPQAALGIHCHDDSGCAVANTLTAVEAGATQVQGTINGIGERTGNANLITIVADLQLKMGAELLEPERLARLTETAHFVDELLNRAPDPAQPYVGKHAFAHKAGMHAAGIQADVSTFEHVDPALVGNSRDVLVSELAGKATIAEKAAEAGLALPAGRDEEFAQRVLDRVKELEHRGFQFEAADGSLELLMRKEAGSYEPLFRLESWRVLVEKRADGKVATEATIKVWLGGERFVRTAEGNGPVNALDAALREAIGELHPHLRDIELVNFKVRILDESHGTGAVTRVLIDAADGHDVWGTIGVSENVIEASWDALVDSLEYGMQPGRRPERDATARGPERSPGRV
jgi:2-isopropylmalate synthase